MTINEIKTEYYTVSVRMNQSENSAGYVMMKENIPAWVSIDYQYNTFQWITNEALAYKFDSKEKAISVARSKVGPSYYSPKPETIRVTKVTQTRTITSEEVDLD
jgi:hypothetical protein